MTRKRKQERILPIGNRVTVIGELVHGNANDGPANGRAVQYGVLHRGYIRPHPYAPPPPLWGVISVPSEHGYERSALRWLQWAGDESSINCNSLLHCKFG